MVDTSVALKGFLPESFSAAADGLLSQFLAGKISLHAPDLLLIESANTLWKRAVLGQGLFTDDVQAIYRDLMTIPLNLYSSEQLVGAALDLAVRHKHSVYDLVYCALAQDLGCDLITADTTLVSKLRKPLPFIRHISELKA